MKPKALAADTEGRAKLVRKLRSLSIRTPSSAASPAVNVVGKKYVFPANDAKLESLTLESDPNGGFATLLVKVNGGEQRIICGKEVWRKGDVSWGRFPSGPTAVSGGWTDPETFTARFCYYETPFLTTVKFKFAGDEVHVDAASNVGFGRTKQPTLIGKVKE
jgi:hypothetical protein